MSKESAAKWYENNKQRKSDSAMKWQRLNPDKVRASSKRRAAGAYASWKRLIASLKQEPCLRCRGKFPPCCMDFHHRDPTLKVFGIGLSNGRPLESILHEIQKCDLLCANCHRITHSKEHADGTRENLVLFQFR